MSRSKPAGTQLTAPPRNDWITVASALDAGQAQYDAVLDSLARATLAATRAARQKARA